MKKPSDLPEDWSALREKIVGLGERSLRKTYYPELQQRLDELERFRALLDQSNDCIFLLRIPSLAFADVNDSACRQLECPRERILSGSLADFVPADAVHALAELIRGTEGAGKGEAIILTRLRRCSGGDLPVEINIRLVNFNRELYGVAVARDITERKRAEKVLLENSRMLRDMELARQIQLSLLPPSPPEVPGLRVAGCCVPAAHVGGDYYDYFLRRDGSVDIVVADVSGHSIGAALMMAEARSVLRAQVSSGTATGDMLGSLNRILYEDLNKSELFITLFYLRYDPEDRILTYSSAGHPPPILFRRGDCRGLDAEGLILGVKSGGVAFEEKRLQMERGDVLVVYTDGIVEAQSPEGELFGGRRLCRVIAAASAESPRTMIEDMLRELASFTGEAAFEDDVTMVVLQVV
jgi:phosphoserine phosphatase RsbU/P